MSERSGNMVAACTLALALCVTGCGNDDNGVDARRIYQVTYSLNITGESTVNSVTYRGGGQSFSVDDPVDGWTISFPGGNGQMIGASADGMAKNGQIVLYMRADPEAGGSPIIHDDSCEEREGNATACALSTAEVVLP